MMGLISKCYGEKMTREYESLQRVVLVFVIVMLLPGGLWDSGNNGSGPDGVPPLEILGIMTA